MRIRVLRTSTTPPNEERLIRLLLDADLPVEVTEKNLSEDEEALLDDQASELDSNDSSTADENDGGLYESDDVYIIVLTPECVDDSETDSVIRWAAIRGQVIGIWPNGIAQGKVPEALERLGGSLVPWDAALIREAVVRGVPMWREPSGDYRAEPKTKRNKC